MPPIPRPCGIWDGRAPSGLLLSVLADPAQFVCIPFAAKAGGTPSHRTGSAVTSYGSISGWGVLVGVVAECRDGGHDLDQVLSRVRDA